MTRLYLAMGLCLGLYACASNELTGSSSKKIAAKSGADSGGDSGGDSDAGDGSADARKDGGGSDSGSDAGKDGGGGGADSGSDSGKDGGPDSGGDSGKDAGNDGPDGGDSDGGDTDSGLSDGEEELKKTRHPMQIDRARGDDEFALTIALFVGGKAVETQTFDFGEDAKQVTAEKLCVTNKTTCVQVSTHNKRTQHDQSVPEQCARATESGKSVKLEMDTDGVAGIGDCLAPMPDETVTLTCPDSSKIEIKGKGC